MAPTWPILYGPGFACDNWTAKLRTNGSIGVMAWAILTLSLSRYVCVLAGDDGGAGAGDEESVGVGERGDKFSKFFRRRVSMSFVPISPNAADSCLEFSCEQPQSRIKGAISRVSLLCIIFPFIEPRPPLAAFF